MNSRFESVLRNKIFGYFAFFITGISILVLFNSDFFVDKENGANVLPAVTRDDSVNVTGTVFGCILNIRVYPEFRVPGNYQTDLDVEIYSSGPTFEGDFTTTTNGLGDSTIDLCAEGINLTAGVYDFYIKGLSHLRFNFDGYSAFGTVESSIDFSSGGERLVAGETSIIYDNVINTLDISTQINNYLGVSTQNDLNQDGIVNNLDINWTVSNYLLEGDCSPEEVANSICD